MGSGMAGAVYWGLRSHTVMVCPRFMNIYAKALSAYLDKSREGAPTQAEFADKVGCTQAAISRYASGRRLPDRALAEKIQSESEGHVSVALWITVASEKAGIAA